MCVYVCVLTCVWLFVIPWTVVHQVPFSTGFSRQEYWHGLPFPTAGDLPGSRDQSCVSCIAKWVLYHWATCNVLLSHSVMSNSLRPFGLLPVRFLCPWDFPGKNTGVGCHFLLQGIFLTEGSNYCLCCLLHCRWVLYPLPSHRGSPSHLGSPM